MYFFTLLRLLLKGWFFGNIFKIIILEEIHDCKKARVKILNFPEFDAILAETSKDGEKMRKK